MASTARAPAAQAQTVLPEEIWEEIFLRLDAAADLARASAACSCFRRIVYERRFLRRFRSLHSPPVLGFIGYREFLPVGPPHRSAPEAHALEQAADFTFSFLPDPSAWRVCHARNGRVLLSRARPISNKIPVLEDFVVCDPLQRRYVKIPSIPDDLMASAADNGMTWLMLSSVLAPAGDNENDEEEWFRVICTVHHKGKGKIVVFIYSSCNQTWRGIFSTISLPKGFIGRETYYAHGCFYWMFDRKGYSLMLTSEMKFSIIDLPPHNFGSMRAIAEAADGRLGFLTIGDGTIEMYCKNWQSNGVGAQGWLHGKLVPLPKESGIKYHWVIEGTAGRYLALAAHHVICNEPPQNCEHFVLDINTLLFEKLCTSDNHMFCGFPYARFLPPLALPSI